MAIEIIMFLLVGAFAGFLAGLLGIGGGLVIVPFLSYYLPYLNIPSEQAMHVSIATSLCLIVWGSLTATVSHHRRGAVLWQIVRMMTLGCIIGSLMGTQLAHWLPSNALRLIFSIFVFYMAYQLAFEHHTDPERRLPKKIGLGIAGFFIASFCNLLGMGGGSLMVPYFTYCNMPVRNAVATSSACGLTIALVGALVYLVGGWLQPGNIPYATGYIYWPAFLVMVLPSIFCAPLGVKLAHHMPTAQLKKGFAIFLVFVGADMLISAIKHFLH